MPKVVLTEELRAQILAGSTEIDLPEPIPAAGAPAASPAPAPVAASPAPGAAALVAAPAAPSADLVAHLTAQIGEKDKAILDLNVKVRGLETQAAEGAGLVPDLLKIAQASVGRMQVALGVADTSSALGAKSAVEEHAKLLKPFTEKFPVGGIGARGNVTDPAAEPAVAEMHAAFAQRLAAITQQRA